VSGLDPTGLEARTLTLLGRVEMMDALVAKAEAPVP
jgi:hypothetical protein